MKSFWLALLWGCFLSGGMVYANSKNLDDSRHTAIEAFEAGRYEDAFAEWKQIAQHYSDPDVFYNIGNSALLAGDIPEAIYAYEQFLRFRPGSKEVKELIATARSQIENAVVPLPKFFLLQWLRSTLAIARPGNWALMGLAAFMIAVGILLAKLGLMNYLSFLKNQNILIFCIAGALFLLIALLSYRQIYRKNEAIVFMKCEMYQGPAVQSPHLRTIYPGEKVIIKDELSGWKRIHLLNLDEGWIGNECVRIIKFENE